MDAYEIISKLKRLKPQMQQEYAVKTVGLFGSFADGTYTDTSDVDILVEFEQPVGWKFFKLENYLEKELHRKIDLVTVNALKEQYKPFVLSHIQYI